MEYSLDTLAETPISKNFIDSKHFFRQKRKEIVNFKSLYNLISRLDRICWTSKFDCHRTTSTAPIKFLVRLASHLNLKVRDYLLFSFQKL